MPKNETLARRLEAALKARGYYTEVDGFQQKRGIQWQRAADRINASTPGDPIHYTSLRRIVVDQTDPYVSTLARICKGLGIPFDELLGG